MLLIHSAVYKLKVTSVAFLAKKSDRRSTAIVDYVDEPTDEP